MQGLCHSCPGGVLNATCASVRQSLQKSWPVCAPYFDKFLPAGGSCGPVHAASHPLPPPECARPAPLPLSLGLFRKHWELRFLRNCSVASVIRPVEAQTSRGVECVCGGEQDAVVCGGVVRYQPVWASGRPDLHPGGSFPNRITLRKSHHLFKALLMAVKQHIFLKSS